MAHVEPPFHQHLLHRRGEVEQPQQVRGGAARAADRRRGLLVREGEFADQPLHALRLLERIEVLALDVLDQRHRQRRLVRHVAHGDRHLGQPGHLPPREAALAGNDLVAVAAGRPDQDRLNDSLRLDRFGSSASASASIRVRGW